MIEHTFDTAHSILYVRLKDSLKQDDFAELAKTVDPYIEQTGDLAGIIIEAPTFPELLHRVFLRLSDYSRASIESLAGKATEKLFQLVVESYSYLQLEVPRPKSLKAVRDELSAGQAKILGYVVEQCRDGAEVT